MFDLPVPSDEASISIHLAASDLYNLLGVIEGNWRVTNPDRQFTDLSLAEKLSLLETADRFDCKRIHSALAWTLDKQYFDSSALDLLEAASEADSVAVGKRAIEKMSDDNEIMRRGGIHKIWPEVMRLIQPSWQVEFQRLFWERSAQRVNRPSVGPARSRRARRRPGDWETVLIKTRRSFTDIGRDFNPKSDVSQRQLK
jgi:hypothetical protein